MAHPGATRWPPASCCAARPTLPCARPPPQPTRLGHLPADRRLVRGRPDHPARRRDQDGRARAARRGPALPGRPLRDLSRRAVRAGRSRPDGLPAAPPGRRGAGDGRGLRFSTRVGRRRRSYHRDSGIGRSGQAGPHCRHEGWREEPRLGSAPRALRAAEGGQGGRWRRARSPAPRAQAPPRVRDRVPRRRAARAGRGRGGGGRGHRGLPAGRALRRRAARDRGRGGGRDRGELAQGHGPGHEGIDGSRRWPGRRQARVGAGAGGAARLMRRQLELSNEVAAALSGSNDQILRALEGHVDCELFLRGNVITLDGEAEAVAAAAVVVRELSDLIEQGHEIAEGTIAAVTDALDQHESPAEVLEDVVWRHRSTRVAPKTVNQKRYVDSIRRNTITFGIGPAGTGKTFLAVAMAAAALSRREVNRIILTRPAVEAGERLGFLPGDLMAKIDPYLRPLFDALHDMLEPEKVAGFLEKGVIEVAPLAFMRGRTLNDSFVILDEAQNTTPEQMKMFLTRLGFGSKMVITGDITQVDLPRDQKSGLIVVGEILREVEGVEFVRFGGGDAARHKMVQRIVAAYDRHAERAARELRPADHRRRTA